MPPFLCIEAIGVRGKFRKLMCSNLSGLTAVRVLSFVGTETRR